MINLVELKQHVLKAQPSHFIFRVIAYKEFTRIHLLH